MMSRQSRVTRGIMCFAPIGGAPKSIVFRPCENKVFQIGNEGIRAICTIPLVTRDKRDGINRPVAKSTLSHLSQNSLAGEFS